MMKTLYCFDFDGTLTNADTMFMFLRFYQPEMFYFQFIKHLPLFLLYGLKILSATYVKKSLIRAMLGGATRNELKVKADEFFREKQVAICREKAVAFISKIDRKEADCYIVSASLDIWLKPFAGYLNMELVATEAKYENNLFTGDFSTPNCTGKEKVNRMKQAIEGKRYKQIIAFGDSDGDRELMAWADVAYYRFFH